MASAIPAAVGAVGGIGSSLLGSYGQEKANDEASKRQLQGEQMNITTS